jgi:hypothetical protein
MGSILAAIITASIALIAAYATTIVAKRHERHLDAVALASGLAGELEAHMSAFPSIKMNWPKKIVDSQDSEHGNMPDMGMPTSPVYESNVGKIGLLGHPLAGQVAYVYEILRAFRGLMYSAVTEQREISGNEFGHRLSVALALLLANEQAGYDLIIALRAFAERKFEAFPSIMIG